MFGHRDVNFAPEAPAAFATLADVKAALAIADGSQDVKLTNLLAVASLAIEGYCGRLIGQRSVVETLFPEDAMQNVVLSKHPASSLGTVLYDGVAQALGDFRLSKTAATVRRYDGGAIAAREIEISYVAGYATAPAPVAEACKKFVAALYNSPAPKFGVAAEAVPDVASVTYGEAGSTSRNGVSIPVEVAALLAPYVSEFQP